MTDGTPASTSPPGRGGVFARAAAWAFVMDSGGQVATLVVSTVLAAILGPEAYGLVAMALVYVMFIQLVQQQGMQAAVIQRAELTGIHKDTAFWLVVGTSLVLTTVSVLLAGWWADVNRQPDLEPILIALSALLPIRALLTVQEGVVRRSLRFRSLAKRTLVSVVVGGAAGLAAALAGWGAWALVVQHLVTAVVGLVVLWTVSDWRPRRRFSRTAARDLMGFSTGSFVSSLGVFVNNKADALLIGLFFGPLVVGIYRFAARLVESVLAMAVRPVQSVALPGLSRHQDEPAAFDRRLLQLMSLSAWLALPALGLLAGTAGTVVEILGPEWAAAVWPLRILCVVGLVRVVVSLNGPMLQARGLVKVQAVTTWVAAGASAGAFVLTAVLLREASTVEQVTGLAATRLLVYGSVVLVMHLWLLRRVSAVPWGRVAMGFVPALLVGSACVLAGVAIEAAAAAWDWHLVWQVAAVVGVGMLAGATVVHRNRTALRSLRTVRAPSAVGTTT